MNREQGSLNIQYSILTFLMWLVSVFHFGKENRLVAESVTVRLSNLFGIENSFARRIICIQLNLYLLTKTPLLDACFLVFHKQTITKECLELCGLQGKTCHLLGDKYFSVLITLVVNFLFWELKCLNANCTLMTVFQVALLCWEGFALTLIFLFSSFGQTCVFCCYVLEVFSCSSSQALRASWQQHTHRHA